MSNSNNTQSKRVADFLSTLGVETHLNYDSAWGTPNSPYASMSLVKAALSYLNPAGANSGIDTIRDTAFYSNEPLKLQFLGSMGYKLDLYTAYDPSHTSYSAEFQSIGSLVSDGYVRIVEGPLEVDNSGWGLINGEQYTALNGQTYTGWDAAAAMQQDIYQKFHAEVPVALFSLAVPTDGASKGPAVQAASQLGTNLSTTADVGNVHFYQHNGNSPEAPVGGEMAGVIEAETGYTAGKNFIISEAGFNDSSQAGINYRGTPDVNAKYTLNLVMDAFAAGSSLTDLYELFDDGVGYTGGNAFEDHWGLFNTNGSPKESAVALHNMLSVLADTSNTSSSFTPGSLGFQLTGMPSSGHSILLEKSSGVYDLVLWNEANIFTNGVATSVQPSTVTITLAVAASVKVFDPMQNAASVAGESNFLTSTPALSPVSQAANALTTQIAVTDHPVIVEVTPQSSSTGTTTPKQGDTLTLRLSEDAYMGDAQVAVQVDGVQIGTMTVSALHSSGDSEVFTLAGNWGQGSHHVSLQFLNDAYGGTPTTDRNLYVASIAYDGMTDAATTAYMPGNGTDTFTVGSGVQSSAIPADLLTVHLSGDAWKGDPLYTILVDGKAISTPQSVTTSRTLGQWMDVSFSGTFGAGSHVIGITFSNDAWGGTSTTDRNLYINGVDVNGTHYGSNVTELLTNGTATFNVTTSR